MESSMSLSHVDLEKMTRLQAFRAKYPYVLKPRGAKIQMSKSSDFSLLRGLGKASAEETHVPPQSCLRSWKKEIAELNKIHSNNKAYVYCNTKTEQRYDMERINELLRVHKGMEIKQEVARELDWFAEETNWPANLVNNLNQKDIKKFQNLIYMRRYDEILSGYDASPQELSRLCCSRWISSDHVSWIIQKLNSTQTEKLCIYMNYTRDIEDFVRKNIAPLRQKPTQFLFILNVGRSGHGNVYLGSDGQPGNHWTLCHVDTQYRTVTYCDSLAWSSPINLLDRIGKFIQATCNEEVSLYKFMYAHDPHSESNGHRCLSSCSPLYPLQRCGNVCGVVVMVVAAIACLAIDFFRRLTKKMDQTPQRSTFLRNPTTYSKYLRLVLMSWIANNEVLVSNVLTSIDDDIGDQPATTSSTSGYRKEGKNEQITEKKENKNEEITGKKEMEEEIAERKEGVEQEVVKSGRRMKLLRKWILNRTKTGEIIGKKTDMRNKKHMKTLMNGVLK